MCTISSASPADEVEAETRAFTDAVNGLQQHQGDTFVCNSDGGIDIDFWFHYADGTAESVRYNTGGCDLVDAGSGRDALVGGAELLTTYVALLGQQRSQVRPPTQAPVPPGCRWGAVGFSLMPVTEPLALAPGARVCAFTPRDEHWRGITLSPAQLSLVADDFVVTKSHRHAEEPCPHNRQLVRLVGYTPWGDPVDLTGFCGRFPLPDAPRIMDAHGRAHTPEWVPGAEAADLLQSVIDAGPVA